MLCSMGIQTLDKWGQHDASLKWLVGVYPVGGMFYQNWILFHQVPLERIFEEFDSGRGTPCPTKNKRHEADGWEERNSRLVLSSDVCCRLVFALRDLQRQSLSSDKWQGRSESNRMHEEGRLQTTSIIRYEVPQWKDERTYGTLVALRGQTHLTVDSNGDRVMLG